MTIPNLSRDDLAAKYLEQLPYAPYPMQEEALLAWFTSDDGMMICAPTGTGKTAIAEAALFEALHTGKTAYYTTPPLIALTEQKFREMQAAAVRWGFPEESVGLVTGNRCVNGDARILVVVAEILLNRLLHPQAFDFSAVATVVMDDSTALPIPSEAWFGNCRSRCFPSMCVMMLSATVGNAAEFIVWLNRSLDRKVDLIQSTERRSP